MKNLATTLTGSVCVCEAKKLKREVLTLQKEILGLRHPDTVSVMDRILGQIVKFIQTAKGVHTWLEALM
ncbi:hypothetical protein FRC19_002410 [Serendipita sp. 401]|nr:hypothetical protein FRC19_002410 [Serendipita sp. 401]